MKITKAEFVTSAVQSSQYPRGGLPEIALIGRSNVGKSSLINAFTNRKRLAKTSSEPGKTRTINFYLINDRFHLVDLPGFGYARVPREVKGAWEKMMDEYLEGRRALRAVAFILDARREVGDFEHMVYEWIGEIGLPSITVFTKTDKLSRNELSSRLSKIRKTLPLSHPVLFSAVTGEGKIALGRRFEETLRGDEGH